MKLVTVTLLAETYLPGGDRPMPAGTLLTTSAAHAAELVAAGLAEGEPAEAEPAERP